MFSGVLVEYDDRPVEGGALLPSELCTPFWVVWSILGAIF